MQILSTLVAFILFCAAAPAGVLMEQVTKDLNRSQQTTTSTMRLDSHRLRVDSAANNKQTIFIYDSGRETMYMIDPAKKTYFEITKQEIENMVAQLSNVQAMLDQQLQNLPPQQRQMMERMMKKQMEAMQQAQPSAATTFNKVASGETVGRWTCDRYEGVREGQKVQDVWTTSPAALGFVMEDFAVLRDLAGMFEGLGSKLDSQIFEVVASAAPEESGLSGVPVRQISYAAGKPQSEFEITAIERRNFSDSEFQVPEGYQKQESPWKDAMKGMPSAPPRTPSPSPAPSPSTEAPATTSAVQPPAPSADSPIECPDAIVMFRENRGGANLVWSSCPPDVAEAVAGPRPAGGAAPRQAASIDLDNANYEEHFSSEPAVLQNNGRLSLSAKRVIRTAVQTAARSAAHALADHAVRQAIQNSVNRAVRDAAVRSAARSAGGGAAGQAVKALGGLGFGNRGKPGYEFVVMETAKAATRAAAGEALFLIPANSAGMRLVRAASHEGFRVLASRPGRVRGNGEFDKPEGSEVMEEVAWQLVRRTARGNVYRVANGLQSGNNYALIDASAGTAYDFTVE